MRQLSSAAACSPLLSTRHTRLTNGDKAPLLFTEGEYERRLAGLRRLMQASHKTFICPMFTD